MLQHFTKNAYNTCDKKTPFMQSVLRHNKDYQFILIGEFLRIINERGMSQVEACEDIKKKGGLISRQNLLKVMKGEFESIPFTYANIISTWCGYYVL
jgi:hypothetical protein